jgi:purine nucleosidase
LDTRAAEIVAAATGNLTLVTLPATMSAWLRAEDVPRLRKGGPLGALLAAQSEAHAKAAGFHDLGRAHPGLPDDLLNFHYDPVTVAAALGLPEVHQRETFLITHLDRGLLRFIPSAQGRAVRVVTEVDGPLFSRTWLSAVCRPRVSGGHDVGDSLGGDAVGQL